jgi:GNAT superfamily N-acetyltransferase
METAAQCWRPMRQGDLAEVLRIAAVVHADLPESATVLAERLALFPAGCIMTAGGYAIAHPARFGAPPALNTLLGALAVDADALHLHDVALVPERQGRGLGAGALRLLAELAPRYGLARITLIAVHGTPEYWRRFGFTDTCVAPAGLGSYGPDARYMSR